jgi:hypothetical protein
LERYLVRDHDAAAVGELVDAVGVTAHGQAVIRMTLAEGVVILELQAVDDLVVELQADRQRG